MPPRQAHPRRPRAGQFAQGKRQQNSPWDATLNEHRPLSQVVRVLFSLYSSLLSESLAQAINEPVRRLIRMLVCDWAQIIRGYHLSRCLCDLLIQRSSLANSTVCRTWLAHAGELSWRHEEFSVKWAQDQRNSIIGKISVWTHKFIMYAAISYYFTQVADMHREETCMDKKSMRLAYNLARLAK